MLGAGGLPLSSAQAVYYLKSYGPLLVLGILCATPLPKMIVAKLRKSKGAATALDVLEPLFVLIPPAARHGIFSGRVVQPVPLLPL